MDMDFFNVVKQYMEQIGGQFTDYDSAKAIIVAPLEQGRFHTIILTLEKNKTTGNQRAVLTTKVCEYTPTINIKELLEQNANTIYGKFILEDGNIKVVVSVPADGISEGEIKYMIQEVASLADSYELKLTGKDIH